MILQLHDVLILHIKRFIIGDVAVTKNNKFLSFSQLLDMTPYCSDECLQVCSLNLKLLYLSHIIATKG